MKPHKAIAYLSIFICTIAAGIPTEALAQNTEDGRTVGIVAHRGFWNCEEAGFARNSVAALRCAQKAGFWGSEFDVNMTADSVLIVFHDSHIKGKKIEKSLYSEIKDITIENGETIPTVDQYLEQGKKHPEMMLVYELKSHSCDEVEDAFVDLTIAKLEEHELLDPERVMFISFSFHICERLASRLPGFSIQYLSGDKKPAKVLKSGINGIDYNFLIFGIKPKWINKADRLGMDTNTWTVNKGEVMVRMIDNGIDFVTTDEPLLLREVIRIMNLTEAGSHQCTSITSSSEVE